MPDHSPTVSIVGATGAVGSEALSILHDRGYAPGAIQCFGSARSEGTSCRYGPHQLTIQPLNSISETPSTYTLVCADSSAARLTRDLLQHCPSTIIDNSSAFRMDPDVPLVIPEINAQQITESTRIIANPNCSTIMMLSAIQPIRKEFGVSSIVVTTYQAVSGAGRAGLDELRTQTHAHLEGQSVPTKTFPHSCAFNVFEHESAIDHQSGFNGEELKMISETRRIWQDQHVPVLPTCIRVPVERAHAQSIILDLNHAATPSQIRSCLEASGVRLHDGEAALTPRDAAGTDGVIVGRIRVDPASSGRRVVLWVCCDQIRKGAALNAVQIMELIETRYKKSTRLGKACAEEQNRKVLA